jgi:Xaa-Pro aminopeptidase
VWPIRTYETLVRMHNEMPGLVIPDQVLERYRVAGPAARDVGLALGHELIEGARAGASGADVDAIARARIDASQFKGLFGHGLGHGVGLRIHEAPTLRPESKDVLEPGNVVTVEPGIYMPGKGGIRIEDLVVVTEGDPEVLTHFSKDLISVE